MKSSRFIIIFIIVSLILHFLLIFINLEPVRAAVTPEPKKLIPVDLAMKAQPEPPAAAPEVTESEPIPAETEPLPQPVPEKSAEPVPETRTVPAETPLPEHPQTAAASAAPVNSSAQPTAPAQTSSGTQNENPYEGLLERINENKKSSYPLSARKKGHQGTVYVLLTLDEEGNMIDAEVVKKASHSSLNTAALKLIKKIMENPYPHGQGKTVRLKLPITYRLDG